MVKNPLMQLDRNLKRMVMVFYSKTSSGMLFKKTHVGIPGIVSMIFGVGLIFTAMGLNGSYNLVFQHVSELGIGPGISGLIFDLGLITSGFIAIPFFIGLGKILDRDGANHRIKKRVVTLSIISCLSLTCTGFFPMYRSIVIIHAIFAFSFFISGLLFCIHFSLLMTKDKRFSKFQANFGYIVAVFFGLFLATPGSGLTEWLVFFSIVSWMVITSIYIYYKKL
ncbi:MAG: DUF998 domain-containing protein [Candidatus Hodarchaeota archaeon]